MFGVVDQKRYRGGWPGMVAAPVQWDDGQTSAKFSVTRDGRRVTSQHHALVLCIVTATHGVLDEEDGQRHQHLSKGIGYIIRIQ
jgi:hypothetical protein